MISAVIFDMDGLMFDTEAVWMRYWPDVAQGFPCESVDEFALASLGVSRERQLELIDEYFGPDIDAEEVLAREEVLVREEMSHAVPKKPGLDRLLAYLAAHNIPMAVASSSPLQDIKMYLRVSGIEDYFTALISGNDVTRPKPAPDVYLTAAKKLSADPKNTLVLEDSFVGVRGANAGGFIVVMVPDLATPTDEILTIADECCESLNEVVDLLESGRLGSTCC